MTPITPTTQAQVNGGKTVNSEQIKEYRKFCNIQKGSTTNETAKIRMQCHRLVNQMINLRNINK